MNSVPGFCVVDTNVPIVANNKSPQVSAGCVLACVDALKSITQRGGITLDSSGLILKEYRDNLLKPGQRGVGDAFMKWVYEHLGDASRCATVDITPKPDDAFDFQEFPNHPGLAKFDRSDRKFVAVSAAHAKHPPILEAADSKWWGWREALKECGIMVSFLCPEDIAEMHKRKSVKK